MLPSALSAENCVLVLYRVGAAALFFFFRAVRPYSSRLFSSDPSLKIKFSRTDTDAGRTYFFFSTGPYCVMGWS